MAEYIERENYCENVCHCANEYCDKESCQIWKAPVADVAPVRHGHWIDGFIPDSMLCGCSKCGFTCGAHSFLFCPMCGARMDGKDGEDNAVD